MDWLVRFSGALLLALAQSAPFILVGYMVAGLIREFLSRETLVHHLGRKGGWPLFKALIVGALLPICSCGTMA